MITALRTLAILTLFMGILFFVLSCVSFFIDVPGFTYNREALETFDQKSDALIFSFITMSVSALVVLFTKLSIFTRFPKLVSLYHWLDTKPISDFTFQVRFLLIIIILGLLAGFPYGSIVNIINILITSPILFSIGFVGGFFVLGIQVINPFCPEPLLRWFTLVTLAFFSIGGIFYILIMMFSETKDPELVSVSMASFGISASAILILRKWTRFEPITTRITANEPKSDK